MPKRKPPRLSSRELRRQICLLTKLKRHLGKTCRELTLQRHCLDHVEDFANFLKQKTTFTVTGEPDLSSVISAHDPSGDDHQTATSITITQQQHYYPGYDEEFQIHHQKFDRDFRYLRKKQVKLCQRDAVSSLYEVLYDLYENCRVVGENAVAADEIIPKSIFDEEMAEREKLQQSLPPPPTIDDDGTIQQQNLEGINLLPSSSELLLPSKPTVLTTIVEVSSDKSKLIKKGKKSKLKAKKKKAAAMKKKQKSNSAINKSKKPPPPVELDEPEESPPPPVSYKKKKKKEKGNFKCPMVSCYKTYKFKDNLLKHLLQHVEVKTEVRDEETVNLPKRARKKTRAGETLNMDGKPRKRRRSSLSGGDRETVFKCDAEGCQYTAPYRSALDLHKVKHSSERPFKCHICEKTFKQIYALKMHEMIHSGQQFQCPFTGCTAIYSWIYSLKKHMRIHTNQAPVHRCEWPACEYQTHRQDLLRKHMTRHTGERHFNCTWPDCGKSFKTRSGLYDHLLMHKNERKQVCTWPGCNYRCNLPGNLRKHLAIHEKKVIKLEPIADTDQISLLTQQYNGAVSAAAAASSAAVAAAAAAGNLANLSALQGQLMQHH